MLHKLRSALLLEWQSLRSWRDWFESDVRGEPEDLDFMASVSAAVMEQSPRGGQQLLWVIFLFFIIALGWAYWAEIDEFTRGEGKVVPSRHLQVVQSLDGGIVSSIEVREGQQVKQGQILLKIDDTRFTSSLRESDVTIMQLQAKAARLRAEAEGTDFITDTLAGVSVDVIREELALSRAREEEHYRATQVFTQQLEQKKQAVNELVAKKAQLARSVSLMSSELDMTRPLAEQGAISQVELLRLERQVNDLQGELEQASLSLPRAESELQEARDKLASADLEFKSKARGELTEVLGELSRLTETSTALEDRVQKTVVRSPVTGTVKQLLVKTLGGVIQPGVNIVEIVPSEDLLQVEARIRPADIAFLHPGQKAMIKFTAYDFAVHGGLDGEVVQISPDTILDEEGNSFYLVRIETVKSYLGKEGNPLPIIPGMTVSTDILTGKKTILDYLLKPILKTKQLALRER